MAAASRIHRLVGRVAVTEGAPTPTIYILVGAGGAARQAREVAGLSLVHLRRMEMGLIPVKLQGSDLENEIARDRLLTQISLPGECARVSFCRCQAGAVAGLGPTLPPLAPRCRKSGRRARDALLAPPVGRSTTELALDDSELSDELDMVESTSSTRGLSSRPRPL